MKFYDLYENSLDRKLNPAVSASDLTDETVLTEITEYVFTPEIVINLYNILTNVKHNEGDHVGIWINGYYGSGKSHFLKYTSYCLAANKEHRDLAFIRLIEATQELQRNERDCELLDNAGVSPNDFKALQNWYVNSADVEMILFNIGDVHDVNADENTAFTTILWNQFNRLRGYNGFNLSLAQYLEKELDKDCKFEEFKEFIKSKGYDWERHLTRFAGGKLNLALELAKQVDPALDTEAIRARVINNDINVSVNAFTDELKEYVESKHDSNFRVMFFIDEVSQFIGEHQDLLLQLQSIVKRFDEECDSKVWVACTGQETLEEVVGNVGGNANPDDKVGKILGRFQVRASLQGTSPEYITQKRILEKKVVARDELEALYEADKAKLDAQFILPTSYRAYTSKEDFAAYYPFVPYQFQLIMKVLDSFVRMNYVDKQVKGNERSLLNITFDIAKKTKNEEVGDFIPFDSFFGAMFQGSMQHVGRKAMENARQAVDIITDHKKQTFYRRVVNVLFMICNMSESDKLSFSATVDNIVTLLMTKVDASKAAIKNDVAQALAYLIDKSVIREIRTDAGTEIYEFYTEEESKVAEMIKNQSVDSNTYCDELWRIIAKYLGLNSGSANKETYATRSFNIQANVNGRSYLSNNPDVIISFMTSSEYPTPDLQAFHNTDNRLIFFLTELYNEDEALRKNFLEYCRVQRYALEESTKAVSIERQKTINMFKERAKTIYDRDIEPRFHALLDTCPVISGMSVLTPAEVGTAKKQERYRNLLQRQFSNLYSYAQLVNSKDTPRTQSELQARIMRHVDPALIDAPLSTAENEVSDYLNRQPHDVTVDEVVRKFSKPAYGWSDFATIDVLNELVRRHLYSFNYNNNPNVSRETVASKIVREASRFTVEKAEAISQEILNAFIDAWKRIFNRMSVPGSNDSTELFRACKDKDDSDLKRLIKNYRDLGRKLDGCPFVVSIDEAVDLMEEWVVIRDPKEFFETVIRDRDRAAVLFDKYKDINTFATDQFAKYRDIIHFLDHSTDNFTFLIPEQHQCVAQLEEIRSDMEPWRNIPKYIKLKRNLEGQLNECRKQLVERIQSNLKAVYAELDAYAKSVNVPDTKYVRYDSELMRRTQTNSFYALDANAQTAQFYEEQMERINTAIPKPPKPKDGDDKDKDKDKNKDKEIRLRKVITLPTHTAAPLKTEADVDAYLNGLKQRIMAVLNSNTDVVIN